MNVCPICVTAADIGFGDATLIVYAHPGCPEHGDRHPFRWRGKVDRCLEGPLRVCACGGYEDVHAASA